MIKITERKQIVYINKYPIYAKIIKTKSFHKPDSFILLNNYPTYVNEEYIIENNKQLFDIFDEMLKNDLEAWSLSRKK
jgi:hypothetical protein